jgi:hypothetical protein
MKPYIPVTGFPSPMKLAAHDITEIRHHNPTLTPPSSTPIIKEVNVIV